MRLKSFITRYDFCMWNSWCFLTKIREDENEKISEQLTDNFFIDFDVILSFAIERCESLCETNREDIFVKNIWFNDVAKEIDEANCEVSEQIIADFSAILYAYSSAKTRRSKFFDITDFRAWCWRICSWNLLLKLKIWLHRLQIVRTHVIRWIDIFFFDFDAELNARNWRFEHFNETNCEDVTMIVLMRFKASCSLMCSKSFLLKLKLCLQDLHIARVTSWLDAFFTISNIVTNVLNEKFKRDAFNLEDK